MLFKSMKTGFTAYRMRLSIDKLSDAFNLSPKEIKTIFSNVKNISAICEQYAAKIYDSELAPQDKKGFDLYTIDRLTRLTSKSSVKGCSRKYGTTFCASSDQGSGRKSSHEKIKSFINKVDFHIIVGVYDFPTLYFIRLPSNYILDWLEENTINQTNGNMSYKSFKGFIDRCKIEDI